MLQQSNAVKLQKNVVDYKTSPFRRDEGEWTTTLLLDGAVFMLLCLLAAA